MGSHHPFAALAYPKTAPYRGSAFRRQRLVATFLKRSWAILAASILKSAMGCEPFSHSDTCVELWIRRLRGSLFFMGIGQE